MYYFIVNPKSCSGRGIKIWDQIKVELDHKNIPYSLYLTEYEQHASEIATMICEQNSEKKEIVVVGGDGTVNEVINGITDYSTVLLGYIPSGSSNDLARSLGIPKDPLEALTHIIEKNNINLYDHGSITIMDTNTVKKFCCSSGLGYDANVCYEVQHSKIKKVLNFFHLGKLTYYIVALLQIIYKKPIECTVYVDGTKKGDYKNLFMASSMIHRYEGGGLLIAPQADPSDRKISVCFVQGFSRFRAFLFLPTIISGKHIKHKGVECFNCTEFEIITKQNCILHTDGELAATCSHIKVNCTKDQIQMII